MKEKVFFYKVQGNDNDVSISEKLKQVLLTHNILDFISEKDFVGVKAHFGEKDHLGFAKPIHYKKIGKLLKEKKAFPFLTETQTLYKGERDNAVKHLELAHKHGFSSDNTDMPIIMLDGLYGDEETEIAIPGKIYNTVKIASLITRCQAMVIVSHFTGHMLSGFGAALKNLGMGCASRKGKMQQHSTVKPKVKAKNCTKCGLCVTWCPTNAIQLEEKAAMINREICIGCGECLAMCRFDAISYNWGATHEDIQKKIVEHAWGVVKAKEHKIVFINFLTNISKDCDCMSTYEKIVDDIGFLISYDPVAIDAASLDMVEQKSGKNMSEIAYNIPYRFQIQYAQEIGFGNPDYELIEV